MIWTNAKIAAGIAAFLTVAVLTTFAAESVHAPPAAALATAPSTQSITFPGGTLELVAVGSGYRSAAAWSADGSPETELPIPWKIGDPENSQSLGLLLKVTPATPDEASPGLRVEGLTGISWGPSHVARGEVAQGFWDLRFDAAAGEQERSIAVSIAPGPFKARLNRIGTAGALTLTDKGGHAYPVIASAAIAAGQGTVMIISDACGGEDVRVTAIDHAGVSHVALVQTSGGPDLMQTTATFPRLRPSNIESITYETRPFIQTVTIQHISLNPGHATHAAMTCAPLTTTPSTQPAAPR